MADGDGRVRVSFLSSFQLIETAPERRLRRAVSVPTTSSESDAILDGTIIRLPIPLGFDSDIM